MGGRCETSVPMGEAMLSSTHCASYMLRSSFHEPYIDLLNLFVFIMLLF